MGTLVTSIDAKAVATSLVRNGVSVIVGSGGGITCLDQQEVETPVRWLRLRV